MNARQSLIRRLRRYADALERHDTDPPRSRVSVPHWRRPHEVVHAERDLSEWVRSRLVAQKDWDSVVQGRNKH